MRLRTRLAILASIPALSLSVGLATATAGNASTANLSFSSTAGNSAHWNARHTAVVLDVNRADAAKGQGGPGAGNAVAYLHSTPTTLPVAAPSMVATNFAAGTPRLDICLSSGGCVFGYPTADGTMTWDSNDGSVPYGSTWDAVRADEASYAVTSVFVVADASQPVPYEATVTSLTYNGATYIP